MPAHARSVLGHLKMASELKGTPIESVKQISFEANIYDKNNEKKQKMEKYIRVFVVMSIGFMSSIIGFSAAYNLAVRKDREALNKSLTSVTKNGEVALESGTSLAFRALRRGSLYAVGGCSAIFYSIWKLSGANNFEEFRYKMGSILPKIPKNDPPQSKTEFEGLTDLLTYVSEDWNQKKE
ncbi:transmembrane protein 242 [Prorops nasuta]|uniref:transmembrane protein 242 n=1 Tax=Prorops nasuta TaxID=863751 RepID=UPI0034CF20AE